MFNFIHLYTHISLDASRLPHQVPQAIVSIDFNTMEAIRSNGGKEERAKLEAGTNGFCFCKWGDDSTSETQVANLMLTVQRAPLRTSARMERPAASKPAAAKNDTC